MGLCYKDSYEGVVTSKLIIVVDTEKFPTTVIYERYLLEQVLV